MRRCACIEAVNHGARHNNAALRASPSGASAPRSFFARVLTASQGSTRDALIPQLSPLMCQRVALGQTNMQKSIRPTGQLNYAAPVLKRKARQSSAVDVVRGQASMG